MTLIILALDALDAGLVDHFDLDELCLETHGSMETFSHMRRVPYTPEVWTTVATGRHPTEHGITDEGLSQWSNPLVEFASRFTGTLPLSTRIRLGEIATELTGAEYVVGNTDQETLFDQPGHVVHNWPGVANGSELATVWKLMDSHGRQSIAEFERELFGIGAQQFAWAEEMLRHGPELAGVHIHTLDVCGHAYHADENQLRSAYEWAANWVERIRTSMDDDDDLVILSDHGMVVSFYSDEDDRGEKPGGHSWRAYAAATLDEIPTSVFEVREWIEANVGTYDDDSAQVELPEERLRELGYIE
ncbi:alkaline phosphatase family protein [Halomicrococcus sp. SG-WS-1]|uniref:alkaline phosphatase family protein n=1 Tax=Halomicrococcus sp. SG-WS-1 TaxID=3439057 RepID=UPI003F78BDE9